jgi:hypothetical protein
MLACGDRRLASFPRLARAMIPCLPRARCERDAAVGARRRGRGTDDLGSGTDSVLEASQLTTKSPRVGAIFVMGFALGMG